MIQGRGKWVSLGMLGMLLSVGCQTWVPEAGVTLPSGRYLQHPPQYIPPSPAFPLSKELTSLEEAAARQPVIGGYYPTPTTP